jgi:hypothetical protein
MSLERCGIEGREMFLECLVCEDVCVCHHAKDEYMWRGVGWMGVVP